MRKYLIYATLCLTLLIASCGLANPAATPQNTSTPASSSGPETGSASISTSYTSTTTYSQDIRFEHFSLEEGLSQSVVNVILQDRTGFLWIGTQDGLNRFDGYGFKIYKPDTSNPNSLSDLWITALTEDKYGNLWVGTRLGGLNRYDPRTGKFTRFMHRETDLESISNNQVLALLADETGIWVGTELGLDFLDYETEKFTHYRESSATPNSLSSNWISALAFDPSGNLWIGTKDAGLNFYDKTKETFKTFKHNEAEATSISNNRILSILVDKQDRLWVGTAHGLNYSETSGQNFLKFIYDPNDTNSISDNIIYTIHQDHSNGIWIGTKNGLNRYDEQQAKFIRHQHQYLISNSLTSNNILSIFEDDNNILWVGTNGGGLNKYNRQQDHFTYYRENPGQINSLSGNFVLPIVIGNNGIAWIGTENGLNRFDTATNQFKLYQHNPNDQNSINTNDIISLTVDGNENLWIGTTRGLDRFTPGTEKFIHFMPDSIKEDSLSGAPVYVIYEDHAGILWIGTGRGLDKIDPQSQTFINYKDENEENAPNNFEGEEIISILEDENFRLWIGTFNDGLKYFDPNSGIITSYVNDPDDPASLGNDTILSLYTDTQGTLWVGTAGGGLNRYNAETDTFTRFTERDGLSNNVIYGILEDKTGNLWVSTNFGISSFNLKTQTFRNYTSNDGLQSNEFNQNAYAKDQKGNLYFGGINGFNVFLPDEIKKNHIPPRVILTSLTMDGKPISEETPAESLQEITLRWPQNSFEFEITGLAFGQPGKNQYAYFLENFDPGWNDIGTRRNGRYTNLPGGTYVLKLRSSNSDGVWNEEGHSIKITVIPPFWQTWWFRSLFILVFSTLIAGGYRWRVTSIQRRNRALERLVQNRTADLEKRNREIEALYQADEKILRNVTLNQVFQTLVDVSISMLKADRSAIFIWHKEKQKILPHVSYGFSPKTLYALSFEAGEGLVGQAMKTGDPIIISDIKLNTLRGDIQTVIRNEGIQSFAHFPIVVDGKVVALFNVGYTRPNALNESTVRLFTALVHRAALSIANMQLFEQTKDLAVMEERNRLARDLHDSAKQKAFAALAQLGTANGIYKTRPDEANIHIGEAETLVYDVIQELTFLIQEIYPIALQERGLPTTLKEYVFEWENRNDAVVKLTIQNEHSLPLETEQAVYRVIQEALANIARHSKAKRVDISLIYSVDLLHITIADDGCGFDMEQKAKGMGFRSMRDRISSVRGTLQVQSASGQGTRVIAQLPIIKNSAGDKS